MKRPVHLNALRAFEASARHQSFVGAAGELHVTAAAVGQLVRTLEQVLGAPLFERDVSGARRLWPTELALAALPDIRAGLDQLAQGWWQLSSGAGGGPLNVAVSPAFASKWLLPRLQRFQQQHPATALRLNSDARALNFAADGIDIGVRYGAGAWPGLHATRLFGESIFPVCSAAYLERRGHPDGTAALAGHALIHDHALRGHALFPTWRHFIGDAILPEQALADGLQINDSGAVLQAAIDGHGIALARSVLAHDDLASKRLVRLTGTPALASPYAYYVVHRQGMPSERIAPLRDWLLAQAGAP